MVMVSRELFAAVKLSPLPAYQIARKARLHPSTLSRIIHGAELVRSGDPRVLAVARVLGLRPEACFVSPPIPPPPPARRREA